MFLPFYQPLVTKVVVTGFIWILTEDDLLSYPYWLFILKNFGSRGNKVVKTVDKCRKTIRETDEFRPYRYDVSKSTSI